MIQRIQSVYLFLAVLALGALFSNLPLVQIAVQNNGTETFTANDTLLIAQEILFGVSAFVTFAGIFLYANRKRQMMAVKAAIVFTVIGLILIAVDYFMANGKAAEGYVVFNPFAVIGTVALILQVMGHKGIASDERLVRQADRLR